MKTRTITFFISFSILFRILISCQSENKKQQEVTESFCDNIHRDSSVNLSQQLVSIKDSMETKTGVYVLEEGDISMISRAWLSEYAERTIDVQYFIFSADNVGLIACDYLLRAADRGVNVRILVDDIMVEGDIDELLALDAHPNLSIKIYNPTTNFGKNILDKVKQLTTNFRGVNQRMHNKTFTVDNKVSITGGRNIADEYFDYDHEYNFRDRDVLLVGKASKDIEHSFNRFWNDTLSVAITKIVNPKDYDLNIETK
ncbi:MAG: phospholipase D family protein, partial [Flavobacteriales bacterium]|nr:phospholipase D family protein [Flavobacteriales bacterium]